MILSPYHNPPYRTPTPSQSSSPQSNIRPSPKRKRGDCNGSHSAAIQIDTDLQPDQLVSSDAESPRTKVAEKFKGLDIIPRASVPRKRLKRNAHLEENSSSAELRAVEKPDQNRYPGDEQADVIPSEISETPNCRTRESSSPSLSPGRLKALQEACDFSNMLDGNPKRARRLPSPPPPTPLELPQNAVAGIDRSVSPLQLPDELPLDQVALTWQDDEITGHKIDPTGDDDGEGINGIGFKPTPAIAYARQQRRNQQVNEWKAREAREARQRRFERRRGEMVCVNGAGQDGNDDMAKGMVRFADVG